MSIDLAKSIRPDQFVIRMVGPQGSVGLSNPVILEQQGLDLRRDLLANLGPKLAFCTQSEVPDESGSAAGLAASRAAGTTFLIEIRDQASSWPVLLDPLIRSFGAIHEAVLSFRPPRKTVADRLLLCISVGQTGRIRST